MLSFSTNSMVRSSLEDMLESIRQRDEIKTPKDMPPVLPPRPASRARLPSIKRPLPMSSEVDENGGAESSLNCSVNKEGRKEQRGNSFGAKRVKEKEPGDSPYIVASKEKEKDNVGYFIEKKLCVWCCLRNGLWETGQIKSTSGENALVLLSDGSVVTVPRQELLPANPEILDGVDDLVQLSYLNEPSVLHNLQYRYLQDIIYSKAGPVLVAFNPFKDLQIYGNDFINAYRKNLLDSPHVYSVADTAYNAMMTDQVNQSIIISGESGSGKTETAKTATQYLAAVGGGGGGIESKVLQASCILEAFGNARTERNENSSRFGKLTEIHFSESGQICGAKIQTFLLEKSRVVQLAHGERSYHVFYQLCSGASSGLRGRLRLKGASDYNYLNQSGCLEIHNIDDAQKFHNLTEALNTIKICKEDQEHIFEVLAAVLWLGNISFLVMDNQNHIKVAPGEAVTNAATLMGCSEQDLVLALSTRKLQSGEDEVTIRLTLEEAIDARDGLASFMYASLFDWLIEEINLSLSVGKHNPGCSISILDIYGFDSFKKNGFEHLCINYANERLQQHFNRHLFKLEQEDYELDGIDWKKVDFEDNQDSLYLFEKKPNGLISLLDEESNFSKATDLTFATKLKQHLNAKHCFRGGTGGTFSVHHYAGEVVYDTGKFLEKNRDQLHFETIQLLSSCTSRPLQYFASTLLKPSQDPESTLMETGMFGCHKPSVFTKFKGELFKLMQHLESTTPHFIRCIRPNDKQIPGVFEKDLALKQLRCCGILEVARISRNGYPTRMTHHEFTRRYGFLLSEDMSSQDPLYTSIAILQKFGILPEMYQVGYTKLYFRAGQIGTLEDVRKSVLQGTMEVQNSPARQDLHELKDVVVTLQSYVRGEIARKEYTALLKLKNQATCEKFNEQMTAVVQLQSVIRGWFARKQFSHLQNSKQLSVSKLRSRRSASEVKDLPPEMLPSIVDELQQRVSMAEAALGHKEKENAALKEQVQQYKTRWAEFETKMKSMEETWEKQMTSLQMNLAAAEKSLVAESTTGQAGRVGGTNGGLNPVSHLAQEFEQRKQAFDDEAKTIVKSSHSFSLNPLEDFRRLKRKFKAWKKDYKARLREAKSKIHVCDADKHRRKWWGKKNKKSKM
ncbi:hypothetical protein ACS0TY_017249 [Phlomoides rotata]